MGGDHMLSERIALLRKQSGWSQEELAERLNVSRQSVSKWESGVSQPELDKVLALSELFGVSTDFLLKGELAEPEPPRPARAPAAEPAIAPDWVEDGLRQLDAGDASRFLENRRRCARVVGIGAAMCVASPAPLIALLGAAGRGSRVLSGGVATGLGVAGLLGMIAAAVGQFISAGMSMARYSGLDREPFLLPPELQADVAREKTGFRQTFVQGIGTGVGLCILSPAPVTLAAIMGSGRRMVMLGAAMLLGMVGLGVFHFVRDGMIMDSFSHVLQTGSHDFTRKLRRHRRVHARIDGPRRIEGE